MSILAAQRAKRFCFAFGGTACSSTGGGTKWIAFGYFSAIGGILYSASCVLDDEIRANPRWPLLSRDEKWSRTKQRFLKLLFPSRQKTIMTSPKILPLSCRIADGATASASTRRLRAASTSTKATSVVDHF
eukprot:TRINITY_DN193614_c0_g1_i1.p1 TRINITY_DN193614_c0_g1~~TRINITY_DN193614_c0_g1_i1.p1  ORF type:complete len:131 (-),score=7.93 TRINITY_DN193614_c0_g1_i1:462-854(-)